MSNSQDYQLQIRLITKQLPYAVPDVPLTVPSSIERTALNDLIQQLLNEHNEGSFKQKEFDFLVFNELLRLPLGDHLKEHNVSTEITIDIEYIERTSAPEPENSLLHDDWISSVKSTDKWILTGCYDYSINIWTIQGRLITSLKHHKNIIKGVSWIDQKDPSKGFVSVSHDLTGIIWSYEEGTANAIPKAVLRGHERGIDSVGISSNSSRIATGGWDNNLKIWSTSLEDGDEEPLQKKGRGINNALTKTPLHTLSGHKETISSVNWVDNYVVQTASMDHTMKFWDVELCGIKTEIVGQKAFLSSSWSPLTNTLLASSADRHIRLYDPRSTEGSLCKTTYTSHTLWVSSVTWSNYDPNLFISGGYDASVKLWDTRSPKAPLYNLQGNQGQVLSVNWSNKKYLVSGGSDNCVHIFKNKDLF